MKSLSKLSLVNGLVFPRQESLDTRGEKGGQYSLLPLNECHLSFSTGDRFLQVPSGLVFLAGPVSESQMLGQDHFMSEQLMLVQEGVVPGRGSRAAQQPLLPCSTAKEGCTVAGGPLLA